MEQINWALLTYVVVGLFALSGFFKGWWKEAIITFFLAILIFFLRVPDAAEMVINWFNRVLVSMRDFLTGLGISSAEGLSQIDATNGGTWLIILILLLSVAILISRLSLQNTIGRSKNYSNYVVTPLGGILGALLGGFNGFLTINLVREYLDGRSLPSGGPPAEIEAARVDRVGFASSGVSIQAVDLPGFDIFTGFLPWIIIAVGLLLFLAALSTRVGLQRFRSLNIKTPFGYRPLTTQIKAGDTADGPPTIIVNQVVQQQKSVIQN